MVDASISMAKLVIRRVIVARTHMIGLLRLEIRLFADKRKVRKDVCY
jgi:hypothetical protein